MEQTIKCLLKVKKLSQECIEIFLSGEIKKQNASLRIQFFQDSPEYTYNSYYQTPDKE